MKEAIGTFFALSLALLAVVIVGFGILVWTLMLLIGGLHAEVWPNLDPLSFGQTSLVAATVIILGGFFNWYTMIGSSNN